MEQAEHVFTMLERLRMSETETEQNKCLDGILSFLSEEQDDEDIDITLETSVENGMLTDLHEILRNTNGATLCKVLQVLAELAKIETVRHPCVAEGFIPPLLQLLSADDITMATQACRALGNICFENDKGRVAVTEDDGIKKLLTLMQSQLKTKEEGTDKLRTIACGFLLNLTNTNEVVMQAAMDAGALDILKEYLQHHTDDSSLCNMVLLTVGSFLDSDTQCRKTLGDSPLCVTIVNLLDGENDLPYQETILDLLISLSEFDEIKDSLAETNLSNHLISIIHQNTGKLDQDSQQTIKLASDLLVLLLTGDKGMETLFGNGEGIVFKEIVTWLESEIHHIQLAAVLAVGNFARNDSHCLKLVEEGIVDKLIQLLKENSSQQSEMTLQHAILSALRNLAIPVANKPPLLMAGVLETVLGLITTDIMPVVFKLLGVLRMMVDGQAIKITDNILVFQLVDKNSDIYSEVYMKEFYISKANNKGFFPVLHETAALQLGNDRGFVDRLVDWCDINSHAGVKGEGTRLLASLVKNGRSSDLMRNIVRAQGIPHLVTMATSEHVVMQNEALVALSLICSTILGEAALHLKQADLIETITTLLGSDTTLPEIVCNTLTLTTTICTTGTLKDDIATSSIPEITRKLCKHDEEKVQTAANTLLACFDEIAVER